ncbi:uncharacterized protein LOC134832746 [Culicoides brevitarsis]|uniref:uncharacterized protein LOC134832746 n=1 Tax=Culicoides brevitarsis TaxID=469753 RepID=UPI00307B267C
MSEVNQANQIFIEDWPVLRDLFTRDWPKYCLPYHLIQNFLDWHKIDPEHVNTDIQLFCLNGDWSDGTFFALDGNSIFFYSLNEDNERLISLLSLLPADREFLACSVYQRHLSVIPTIVPRFSNWEQKFTLMTFFHRLPKEKALAMEIDIPEGISVKPMSSDDHIATVDSVYPHRTENVTAQGFKRLLKFNLNLGAFDAEENLLAWCFRYQTGTLSALQVLHGGQMRQGLGSLIVKSMAKKLAEEGFDTLACVTEGNIPSMKLFEKLGFEIIDKVYWVGFGNRDIEGTIGHIGN